jgi:predicted glycogen debranching enzyme
MAINPLHAPSTPTSSWLPAYALPAISLGRDITTDREAGTRREWLVTNGIGGFAAGTVAGPLTRRYHGLLMAALDPPLGRTLMVASLECQVRYLGREHELSANEYHGDNWHPAGWRYLESFSVTGGVPAWEYAFADVRLTRRIWMVPGANTTCIEYQLTSASAPVTLQLTPLCTYRDYHAHSRGGWMPGTAAVPGGVEIRAFDGARPCRITGDGESTFEPGAGWYWNFRHRLEAERGLDDTEDLFAPGRFSVELSAGSTFTLTCTAEPDAAGSTDHPIDNSEPTGRARQLLANFNPEPAWIQQLVLAADQFIARRGLAANGGSTVIAGYPWFGDWGRDTMIALPGLTLSTGRPEVAARVLRTFAAHVDAGMLPNRFPDQGDMPEYNTADATLWYFNAVDEYVAATGDLALLRELWPVLTDIVAWHLRGTRHGIAVDPADNLLRAGEPGVQLTWMDAKVGDWVVTPRIGKPVEINALWHHALNVMGEFAARLRDTGATHRYQALAAGVRAAFRERYWSASLGYLYDVIDGPEGEPDAAGRRRDASLRPNQVFAVSLRSPLLGDAEARSVVAACGRALLTPVGLRSLSADDPRYVGVYAGGPRERDGAYHQGTVWSWLLGPYALAHYRVHRDARAARALLAGIAPHLTEACVGSISEIFDGEPPHHPRGCFAQAWSVAEVLRAWVELGEEK